MLRGHSIDWDTNYAWVFSDIREPTVETHESRTCNNCRCHRTPEGHDACLGTLPGVMNACCGHGCDDDAYVQFYSGKIVRGREAVKWVQKQRC